MMVLCLTDVNRLIKPNYKHGEVYIVSLKNGDLSLAQSINNQFIRDGIDITEYVVGFTLKSNFGVSIGLGQHVNYNLK